MEAPFTIRENSGNIVPAWAKPVSADQWVVRWHEVSGRTGQAGLSAAEGWQLARSDFDGKASGDSSSDLVLELTPYQIGTTLLTPTIL